MTSQLLDKALDSNMAATVPIPVLDAAVPQERHASSSPVLRVFAVVCVAAAMNLVFFPRAVVDRLSDLEPGPVVDVLVMTAEAVASASDRTELPAFFEGLREGFLDRTAR